MAESVDETAAVEAVETAVALDLAPTQAEELAWSSEQQELGDLTPVPPMPLPVEPAPWRAVCRNALAVFSVCVAVAGAVTLVDRQWFTELTEVVAPTPPTAAPSTAIPAPTEAAAQSEAWTLPPVPVAERLREPEPVMVPAAPDTYTDAAFIAALSRNGVSVYDPQSTVLLAHMACSELGAGRSVVSVASELKAGQNSSSRAPIDMATAMAFVAASVNYYCPQFR